MIKTENCLLDFEVKKYFGDFGKSSFIGLVENRKMIVID